MPVAAIAAPLVFWLSAPPGRTRAAGTWALQMWAYKVLFEMPYDRPWRLRRRLHIDYVVELDRALGLGTPTRQRLQQAFLATVVKAAEPALRPHAAGVLQMLGRLEQRVKG